MVAELSDYKVVIKQQKCIKDPVLSGGKVRLLPSGDPWRDIGGFCVVFKYETSRKNYAIRCWYQELDGIKERTSKIASTINQSGLPYFVEFKYVENGIFTMNAGIQPIIRMEWVDACNLKEYIYKNKSYTSKLFKLAHDFHKMCCDLHKANISHGDLQHANIKVRENGDLVLLDYDSLYHPNMGNLSDYIHGKTDYQHPLRKDNRYATKHIDAFSELVIFTSIIYYANNPSDYTQKNSESEFMLFETADYKNITDSEGYAKLLCWSPQTEFLAKVLVDNLQKNNLNDIDNIEKVVNTASTKGINLFIQNKYSEKELYEIAIKESNNSNTTKNAIIRFEYLSDKNFSDAKIKLAQLSANKDTINSELLIQLIEGIKQQQQQQEQERRRQQQQQEAERRRQELERLRRQQEQQEAERIRQQQEKEKRIKRIGKIVLFVIAFIALATFNNYRKDKKEYRKLVAQSEKYVKQQQYQKATESLIKIKQITNNKKMVADANARLDKINYEIEKISKTLREEINTVWESYFIKKDGVISTTLDKNIMKYINKKEMPPIIESISQKTEKLKNATDNQKEYNDNIKRLNILIKYYNAQ